MIVYCYWMISVDFAGRNIISPLHNIIMKGQTLVFEQVILFMISVAIFIACYSMFTIYQKHYAYLTASDQTKAVRDQVSANIVKIAKFDGMDASVKFSIPKKISGEDYNVFFSGGSVNVTTLQTGVSASSGLYGLDYRKGGSFSFSGKAASSKGEIVIYKRGRNIIIG